MKTIDDSRPVSKQQLLTCILWLLELIEMPEGQKPYERARTISAVRGVLVKGYLEKEEVV